MERKLIVAVIKAREAGRAVPRHNLAFATPYRGILTLNEESVRTLNRHALVAVLRDPQTGAGVAGLHPLIDARLLRATCDEWVLTGFERVTIGLQECDCAQSWIVRLDELIDDARQSKEL